MFGPKSWHVVAWSAAGIIAVSFVAAPAADAALRVVSYNLNADTDRDNDNDIDAVDGTPRPQLGGVLQAIGNYALAGRSQPIDVLALQELYNTPTVTLQSVVNSLNAAYGAGQYAFAPIVGGTTGNLPGNGPNGLIYNTQTVQMIQAAPVGTASGNGAARTPVRYQLRALGETGANTFYLYNSHAKAGGTADDVGRRAIEADSIRANADALGSSAKVIYTGDMNLVYGSNDSFYRELRAAPGTTLATSGNPTGGAPLVAGVAQAFDPVANTFASNSTAAENERLYTESATDLTARFDLQLLTQNVLPGSPQPGLQLVPNTYTAFGNSFYNGSALTSINNRGGNVDTAANASATGIPLSILQGLTNVTDHLPVVADYVIAVPEPGMMAVLGVTAVVGLRRRRRQSR